MKASAAGGLAARWLPALLRAVLSALLVATCGAAFADGITARDFKIEGDSGRVHVTIGFDAEPDLRWFMLRAPYRLAVELPQTRFLFEPAQTKPAGLIRAVRYGGIGAGAARIVLTAAGPFRVDNVETAADADGNGYHMALDIASASAREFDQALADQALATGATVATPKGDRVGPAVDRPAKIFTIVIDPGHGGADSGAVGVSGSQEKDITLAFAQALRDRLTATGRYQVFMTRDADAFIRLDDRVQFARDHGASLLISIHADKISLKGLRGATVYTMSETASDAEAQAVADRENLSDKLAGIEMQDTNHEVSDILVDLIKRETHNFSVRFANALVGELSNNIGMIKNPHRFAGFRVLRAPDVPSVLVELGYLSNVKDESQLNDPQWRDSTAAAIVNAIGTFVAARAAGG